jgi:hypothetical protein
MSNDRHVPDVILVVHDLTDLFNREVHHLAPSTMDLIILTKFNSLINTPDWFKSTTGGSRPFGAPGARPEANLHRRSPSAWMRPFGGGGGFWNLGTGAVFNRLPAAGFCVSCGRHPLPVSLPAFQYPLHVRFLQHFYKIFRVLPGGGANKFPVLLHSGGFAPVHGPFGRNSSLAFVFHFLI